MIILTILQVKENDFYSTVVHLKDAGSMANNVDPHQTAPVLGAV